MKFSKNYKKLFLTGLILVVSNLILAQNQDIYSFEHFVHKGDTLQYRMLLPKDFSKEKKYPLVLFLHGSGERGNDNRAQLVHGGELFANEKIRDSFPAIIIFPQCPKEDNWADEKNNHSNNGLVKFKKFGKPTKSMKLVLALMDEMLGKPYVQNNQVYVGGLSMGGIGTFDILKRRPNMFAAAFPICGGGNPKSIKKYYNKISVWIFHGGKDDVVIPYLSLQMFVALQEKGADVRLSYFENDNHNSWDSTFAEPKLLPWLFSKSKLK